MYLTGYITQLGVHKILIVFTCRQVKSLKFDLHAHALTLEMSTNPFWFDRAIKMRINPAVPTNMEMMSKARWTCGYN